MAWYLDLDDDTTVALTDFPTAVVSQIATANGMLWSVMLDEPLANIGAAASMIAYACGAYGVKIPPISSVGDAWNAARSMYRFEVDEVPGVEAVAGEPIAWAAASE